MLHCDAACCNEMSGFAEKKVIFANLKYYMTMNKLFVAGLLAMAMCACGSQEGAKKVRLNVEMTVSAQNRPALMDNMLRLAEASRAEEGCLGYEVYENSRDSSRVMIVETWESEAALEAHQQTEHFKTRAPKNDELRTSSTLMKFEF